jgi:chitinase
LRTHLKLVLLFCDLSATYFVIIKSLLSHHHLVKTATFFMNKPSIVTAIFVVCISLTLFSCGSNDEDKPQNQVPVVSNVLPASESLISNGEEITLSADVSDPDGKIVKVEFLIGGVVVGQAVSEPYEFHWTPAESGHYTYSVRAFDNEGATGLQGTMILTAVGYSCTEENVCSFEAKNFDNVVMAFYPSWKVGQMPVASVPWEKLTHVNYSFATPEEDGELNTSDIDAQIDNVVTTAHAKGVKVYISIGGAGASEPFITLSKNARTRALFVDRVKCYIKTHCLDGVDIDWEHWNGADQIIAAESNGLVDLLKDLRAGLDNETEISTDVFASNWFGKHYMDEIVDEVTYVNTMLYDLRGSWSEEGPHSGYDEVISDGTTNYSINSWGLSYWTGYRTWPAEKTIVGMPFYGRDFNANGGDGIDYRDIVTLVQNTAGDINADKFNKIYYDGPETAARKAAYARDHGYAGVMFWELTGDTNDEETSLLEAIGGELN